MNQHTIQHLIDQALEHQITSGFTDEIYIKGRACVSKAFTDKLIELVLKECINITEYCLDDTYTYADDILKKHFGIKS